MLILHVLDLNGEKRAVTDRLLKHLTGIVGMDVKLDEVLGINEHDAVTDAADKPFVVNAIQEFTRQGKYPDGLWK